MTPQDNQRATIDGEEIVAMCARLGFALAGVTKACETEFDRELRGWLADGGHGSMAWLAEHTDLRADPREMMPGANSIVMVADLYARGGAPEDAESGRGRVAKYARGDDYHEVMKKRLHELADALRDEHPGERFRAFVDTAPVLEREHASRAGLGWLGKHTLTINPVLGSYLLLGGILTTLEITPPDGQSARWDPVRATPETGHCGTCTRCIDACPTDAITPWSVNATRCISYLTIEHRGEIDERFWRSIGDNLYGCDICQDVCPHNSDTDEDAEIRPEYAPRNASFDLLDVLGWTEDDRRAAFRRSAMKRANLPMMKRNAIVCAVNAIEGGAENAGDLRARIDELSSETDDLVSATARVALRVLSG